METERKFTDREILSAARTLCALLYKAKCLGVLDECIPDGMKVELSTHSTATHCHIYMVDGDERLLVWYRTNWCHPQYEFNERDKVIGLQKGCEFAEPYLISLFDAVLQAVHAKEQEREAREAEKKAGAKQAHDERLARFAKKFG